MWLVINWHHSTICLVLIDWLMSVCSTDCVEVLLGADRDVWCCRWHLSSVWHLVKHPAVEVCSLILAVCIQCCPFTNAPWFCSFRLWRSINHFLTYLHAHDNTVLSIVITDCCSQVVFLFVTVPCHSVNICIVVMHMTSCTYVLFLLFSALKKQLI